MYLPTKSKVNYVGKNETDGGHQYIIFWFLFGLCLLLFSAWLCFIIRSRKKEKSINMNPPSSED